MTTHIGHQFHWGIPEWLQAYIDQDVSGLLVQSATFRFGLDEWATVTLEALGPGEAVELRKRMAERGFVVHVTEPEDQP